MSTGCRYRSPVDALPCRLRDGHEGAHQIDIPISSVKSSAAVDAMVRSLPPVGVDTLRLEPLSTATIRRMLPVAGDKLLLSMLVTMLVQRYLQPDNGYCSDCHGIWLYKNGRVDLAGGEHRDDCLIHLARAALTSARTHRAGGCTFQTAFGSCVLEAGHGGLHNGVYDHRRGEKR